MNESQAMLFSEPKAADFACTSKSVQRRLEIQRSDCERLETITSVPQPKLADSLADTNDAVSSHIAAVALHLVRTRGRVSADDFHDDPQLLGGRDGRVIGAVLRGLVKAGAIKPDGYFASVRSENHHRPIQRFIAP